LRESVFLAVIVVPELGDDEDVLTLDESLVDGTLDALSCFLFVLVVVCTVEEAVADFDGLDAVSLLILQSMFVSSNSHCRLYRLLGRRALSRDRSLQEACHGQKPT
jgi:hypothetical protein